MLTSQKNLKPKPSSESGYTLLEGIMAIVVVAVLMTVITPLIVWATATRVQSKRVQLSTQASRTYIATVQAKPVDLAPGTMTQNNKKASEAEPPDADQFKACETPKNTDGTALTGDAVKDFYCDEDKLLYCVNFDDTPGCQSDSLGDMVVQPVMQPFDSTTNLPENGYQLGIRVYRARSFADDVGALKGKDNDKVDDPRVGSSGKGLLLLGKLSSPLMKQTAYIPPSGNNSFATYCAAIANQKNVTNPACQ